MPDRIDHVYKKNCKQDESRGAAEMPETVRGKAVKSGGTKKEKNRYEKRFAVRLARTYSERYGCDQ